MVTADARPKIEVRDLWITYNEITALKGISLTIQKSEILGIIGPANSGKTSFLRTLNRLNDGLPDYSMRGEVLLDGQNIHKQLSAPFLRQKIGMIFALPTPLPLSIYENVAYGPQVHGIKSKIALDRIVEECLTAAFLWEEVKDRLELPAMRLSGGQQQRLCIARALAVDPDVILYDEPCSGLDPISTAKVEEAMQQLKSRYTQVLVTNNTKQAARTSDRTAFFLMGDLIEVDETDKIFTVPQDKRTEDYVSGRFG